MSIFSVAPCDRWWCNILNCGFVMRYSFFILCMRAMSSASSANASITVLLFALALCLTILLVLYFLCTEFRSSLDAAVIKVNFSYFLLLIRFHVLSDIQSIWLCLPSVSLATSSALAFMVSNFWSGTTSLFLRIQFISNISLKHFQANMVF